MTLKEVLELLKFLSMILEHPKQQLIVSPIPARVGICDQLCPPANRCAFATVREE
ncbi:uncharacterized protein K460DRAFT_367890 [Cucurbitaria berberidis CBS 394.84]|uniref:Uncharacterized protein n=1 Tax=Cucurbitaria berberidis CBS 394.84 TaxID=1168544 RepID=A0A9P4GC89_9PLEO|nr:uncharacterized protein K460DRAFT_367890 [Cucurbitaria berberidis CBS 394.84]KAF1842972.1 hypothetical protein K460DRAFT_367890 [Cucurbitaria berberidis CBS 394.84]